MVKTIVRKEIQLLLRDKTIGSFALVVGLCLLIALVISLMNYRSGERSSRLSNQMFRRQWEKLHENPHDAAHYGTYLFKPVNFLTTFDSGLNDYFGTSYRVEAHKQNEVNYSSAQGNDAALRFGQFTLAVIMQLIVPLFLLFIASSAVTQERESGTLRILMAQGVKPAELLWGKVGAYYLVALTVILPIFFMNTLIILSGPQPGLLGRLLISTGSYLIYYFAVVLLAVILSAVSNNSRNAMLSVLGIWLMACIIMPKLVTGFADHKYPLVSRATFNDAVEKGFINGLNGNDKYYDRGDRYVKQLLKKYHADTISQLPVDAGGIIMQLNEDYQNRVFDHFYHQIEFTFGKQQAYLDNAALLNPFIALKRISMASSGTDFYHHNKFFNQARTYRNNFIRKLNMEVALHPMKNGGTYTAGPDFFRSIPDFQYQLPAAAEVLQLQWKELVSLLGWVLIFSLLLRYIAYRFLI